MTTASRPLCVARVVIHADCKILGELEQRLAESTANGTASFLDALIDAPDEFCARSGDEDSHTLYEQTGFESVAGWRYVNWGTSARDYLVSYERRRRTLVATFVTTWSLPDPGLQEVARRYNVKMYVNWYDNVLRMHGRKCYPDGVGHEWIRDLGRLKLDDPVVAKVLDRVRSSEF